MVVFMFKKGIVAKSHSWQERKDGHDHRFGQ